MLQKCLKQQRQTTPLASELVRISLWFAVLSQPHRSVTQLTFVTPDIAKQLDKQIRATASHMNQRTLLPQPHARSDRKNLVESASCHVKRDGEETPKTLTRPKDLVMRVQVPRNLRMTKPPRTVLISGIPLCFAWIPYSATSRAAQKAKPICRTS